MSEENKLFNFMSGLQMWAKIELRRQGVRDLLLAIVDVDGLIDYNLSKTSNVAEPSSKPKNKGKK